MRQKDRKEKRKEGKERKKEGDWEIETEKILGRIKGSSEI